MLDLVLPGADGIELMRTLPALADLPVIFVSAYGGDDARKPRYIFGERGLGYRMPAPDDP